MLRRLERVTCRSESVAVGSHPADIPRTPPFAAVRQSVDNSLTYRDSSPKSAKVRRKHVRNVEVGYLVNSPSGVAWAAKRLA
jgi:hypothetical protein